jgi:hypothetical protein
MPDEVVAEDREIARFPLQVPDDRITTVAVDEVFAGP